MTETLTPPLKWHGGKHYLAKKIIELMPPHLHYVEPYFGGGAVLLAKNPNDVSEVINDIDGSLTNFWRVLQSPLCFETFKRSIEATPFSEVQFNGSFTVTDMDSGAPLSISPIRSSLNVISVPSAVRFFIKCRQSLAGRMDSFAPLSRNRTRRGMNEQVSAWLTTIDGLADVHARLRRVVILNRDALNVIRSQDGLHTLFYLDPPYLHSTRSTTGEYQFEIDEQQHKDLLTLLVAIKGKFLLSGYRSELYDDVALANGWTRHEFELPNNAASGANKKRMTECVWSNHD